MSAELTLAEPLKSRLILEMAADLEAMTEHFRSRGMSDEAAAVEAEERLLASPQALEALVRVHTTGFERAAARVAWALRGGADLVLFLFGIGPLVGAAVLAVTGQLGGKPVSPAVGVVLVAGVALMAMVARAAWRLRCGGVERRRVTEALTGILLLSAATAVAGATVFLAGVQGMLASFAKTIEDPEAVAAAAADLTSHATLLTLSLLVGFAGALCWFVLTNRLAAAEQAESAALLAG